VFGQYFWTGKGFGVNLADDDGFQVSSPDQAPLRSPHNVNMTVLARMGLPGVVVWALLQGCFALALIRAYMRARLTHAHRWAKINLWILGYWCAFHVNAAFDVYIEGPHGGIWFWCLMGAGIAVLESQRRESAAAWGRRLS
jgi:O-antigen ligase